MNKTIFDIAYSYDTVFRQYDILTDEAKIYLIELNEDIFYFDNEYYLLGSEFKLILNGKIGFCYHQLLKAEYNQVIKEHIKIRRRKKIIQELD